MVLRDSSGCRVPAAPGGLAGLPSLLYLVSVSRLLLEAVHSALSYLAGRAATYIHVYLILFTGRGEFSVLQRRLHLGAAREVGNYGLQLRGMVFSSITKRKKGVWILRIICL